MPLLVTIPLDHVNVFRYFRCFHKLRKPHPSPRASVPASPVNTQSAARVARFEIIIEIPSLQRRRDLLFGSRCTLFASCICSPAGFLDALSKQAEDDAPHTPIGDEAEISTVMMAMPRAPRRSLLKVSKLNHL